MKNTALLLPIAAGIMFGSGGIFVRTLGDAGMSNATILFLRVIFGVLMMGIFLFSTNKDLLKIKMRDLPLFMGTGLLGMMCLNLCYNEAIGELTLSLAAVLLSTAPVFVVILAAILFKEKITGRKVGCMLMAMMGCLFASGLLESGQGITVSGIGMMFGVGSALFYALYSIFSRLATDKGYHTYTAIFYSVLLISIVLLPVADLTAVGDYIVEAPVAGIGYLCLHALVTSVLPYIFITAALLYVEAGTVSILASGGEPIAAVLFGILFYAEIPTALMLAGLLLTIVALALLFKKKEA